MVQSTDVVVLVVGLSSSDEGEGHDRISLTYPGNQSALIEKVAAAGSEQRKPVVVVTMGGGPVDLTAVKSNPNIGAIIWCGYPGMEGGNAIADAVFGVTNAWGRLTQTWYAEEFVNETLMTDFHMRPNSTSGYPGRTYRFYTGSPVYKFGDGLTYTNFESHLTVPSTVSLGRVSNDLSSRPLRRDALVVARANVTVVNTGNRDGDEVMMLFASPPSPGLGGAPLRHLVDFKRVHVPVGDIVSAQFDLRSVHFSFADAEGHRITQDGEWKFWIGSRGEANAHSVMLR